MEMGRKALIITGENVQDHEFIYPYYRLKEAGYAVTVALKDRKGTTGYYGTRIPCDKYCEVISYEDLFIYGDFFDLLILPGGAKCMEKLRQERIVLKFISDWNMKEKLIGSICHGAQLLISANVVKGRAISGYYSIEDDIKNAGAIYTPSVVESWNIISASHYKYLGEWMRIILKKLK